MFHPSQLPTVKVLACCALMLAYPANSADSDAFIEDRLTQAHEGNPVYWHERQGVSVFRHNSSQIFEMARPLQLAIKGLGFSPDGHCAAAIIRTVKDINPEDGVLDLAHAGIALSYRTSGGWKQEAKLVAKVLPPNTQGIEEIATVSNSGRVFLVKARRILKTKEGSRTACEWVCLNENSEIVPLTRLLD